MIWLTGSAGMLGTEVGAELERRGIPFRATDREVDITAPEAVRAFFGAYRPEGVINCAAYTAVDRAEEEPESAWRLNVLGPENLARNCAERGAVLVHVSTDYVFDGRGTVAYGEDAEPNPVSVYGKTKAAGEKRVVALLREHILCRTAWLFGLGGNNFVATMLRLFAERDEVSVVSDQRGRPTYARDLASVLVTLLELGGSAAPWGVYHCANAGETSWYELAAEIHRQAVVRGLVSGECRVYAVSSAEYPSAARRPANSVLETGRLESVLGHPLRHWKSALADYLDEVEAAGAGR
ncbi:MAG: dTDP-4-dehydrorhamnose reductase [Spirochaetaceae bacterium]